MEYFKRDLDGYTTTMNPVVNYSEQAVKFIMTYSGMEKPEAVKVLRKCCIKKKLKNPLLTYRGRKPNGDREDMTLSLTDYIKSAVSSGDIIVPSFTVYDSPKVNKSLHAEFLTANIKRRSEHKKKAFAAYQDGNMQEFLSNDVLQKVMKIFNNSLSGAYGSQSTTLYNPSQHYTLTSMTRSVASIGNGVTESVVAGNKLLYTPDAVMNYITACITIPNLKKISSAMSTYSIKYPSIAEVHTMLRYSSDRYWSDSESQTKIAKYLSKLSPVELASIMYVNDLFHLRMHNEELVKNFLTKLSTRCVSGSDAPLKILSRDIEGINNLAHLICIEDIKGLKVDYKKLETENPSLLELLGSTAENIYKTLNEYRLLLKAFFVTDMLPIDIANVKDMSRDVIVLSDTDSTCGSYDNWVHWYYGSTKFTQEAIALSAAVMTINTQVIDHNLRIFSKNMNIEKESVGLLKMKNEYFWSAFVVCNISKHYYANTWFQEGNAYKEPKLELKGVHLIASSGNQDIVSKAHADMSAYLKSFEDGNKISAKVVLKKVADLERLILKTIATGDVGIYKLEKIKPFESYNGDTPEKTPYFHHMLWDKVFRDKYGDPGDPTYLVIKLPTTLKSKRTMTEWIDKLEDRNVADKLSAVVRNAGKTHIGTFRLPLNVVGEHGVPKELLSAVDRHRCVVDQCNIFYLLLETIGIYRKPGMLFSELGY